MTLHVRPGSRTARLGVLVTAVVTALALGIPAEAHDGGSHVSALAEPDPFFHAGHDASPGEAYVAALVPGPTGAYTENTEHVAARNGFTGGHVMTRGERLYVGSYGVGMRIFDVSDPADPEEIGDYTPGGPRADAVPEAGEFDGRHIATLNGTRRTSFSQDTRTDRSEFLDVTDPADPVLLHEFVGQDDGEAHNGDYVSRERLWLPSGGAGAYGDDGGAPEELRPRQRYDHHRGLRIYDLDPVIDTEASDCEPDAGWDNPCVPGLLFAANPVELWEDSPFRKGREVGHDFTHTHDITIYEDFQLDRGPKRDIALLAEGGSYLDDDGNTGSVFVIDITNPTKPTVLNRFIHPGYDDGRDHDPIRYYHEAQFLDGDPSVMIIADEDMHSGCDRGGALYTVRVSANLREAEPLDEWHTPTTTPASVCSVHVFDSEGPLIFNGAYNGGVQVIDASDPADLQQAGFGIAPGSTAWGAWFHEGYVYVGDMTRGLDVFRYTGGTSTEPEATTLLGGPS